MADQSAMARNGEGVSGAVDRRAPSCRMEALVMVKLTPSRVQAPGILILDEDPTEGAALAQRLSAWGHAVEHVTRCGEAWQLLRDAERGLNDSIHVVLVDLDAETFDPVDMIARCADRTQAIVIAVAGPRDVRTAIEAMKRGASDCLVRPLDDRALRLLMDQAQQRHVLQSEQCVPASEAGPSMVGSDPKILRLWELVDAVAPTDTTVLIEGESGTGKTMLARRLHDRSERHQAPFVTFSCGSVPETLLESELFGHTRGAFTGAVADKVGRLAAAESGTLFIDEINTASMALQIKLLRVLQDKTYEPVGSSETRKADVRFVVAANESLESLVAEGRFRSDLFYRIHVMHLPLPPLRERQTDLAMLAEHLLQKHARRLGRIITGFAPEAMQALQAHHWPGNVRELENAVERAAVMARRPRIALEDLPEKLSRQNALPARSSHEVTSDAWSPQSLNDALAEPERRILIAALRACGGSRQEASRLLDINRTTLYKKMKAHGLDEPGAF